VDRRDGRDTFLEGGSGRFVIEKSAQVVADRSGETRFQRRASCAFSPHRLAGDVGGATIIERIYLRKGLKFVFTPNGWFYWNGIIWVADEGGGHILRIMREELVKVEKGYLAEGGLNLEARSDDASMESDDESLTDSGTAGTGGSRKKKEPKIVNFNFNAKMSNVLTTCKELFFNAGFEGKLDFNRDFRAAQNGVIDLKTGNFQPHHPRVSATNGLCHFCSSSLRFLVANSSRSAAVYLER
jgi:hypothetical protein